MKVGIIGAGGIAATQAETIRRTPEVEGYAIGSRSLEKAHAFAEKHGISKAYGSYEELLSDPEVDLVYVATPHSEHAAVMKAAILHGKAVLCEKAFTVNAKQAREIADLAREKGVFVTEAIWPRYMPSRKIINDVIASGRIGRIFALTANLCYKIDQVPRLVQPELAGGALLDVGVYGINFALMHFGDDIEKMESSVKMTDTGVDGMENITIHYRDGRIATVIGGMYGRSDRKGIFYGERGYIIVENINNPQSVSIFDDGDNLLETIPVPPQITGYEYQLLECKRMLEEGRTQSESMPLEDTIRMMEVMDRLRASWGLKYPME
jgi:predicted dehydrogenase